MFTFMVLLVIALIAAIILFVILLIAGIGGWILFGDLITCILIIVGLVKLGKRRR